MSRASGCLWLGVALILALVAGGAAFVTLQRATSVAQAANEAPASTASVVAAAHAVALGAQLTAGDLVLQALPVSAVPQGAVTKIADAAGKVTMISLDAGEPVLTDHLTQPDISAAERGLYPAARQSCRDVAVQRSLEQPGSCPAKRSR